MENEQKNSGFKAATVVLSLLLVGSLAYNFRTYNETKTFESKIAFVKSEKNTVMDSLVALRTTYENALKDKTSISKDLISSGLLKAINFL